MTRRIQPTHPAHYYVKCAQIIARIPLPITEFRATLVARVLDGEYDNATYMIDAAKSSTDAMRLYGEILQTAMRHPSFREEMQYLEWSASERRKLKEI